MIIRKFLSILIIKPIIRPYITNRILKLKNSSIGKHSTIGEAVVIGKNVKIGRDTILRKITIKHNSVIESFVKCVGTEKGCIFVGSNSYIGISNVLDNSDNIQIGNFVHIAGPTTALWTHSSAKMCMNSIPLNKATEKYRPTAPIKIEDNVYIGGNCTIYPGVKIGHHSIVAPNSSVTKDIPPYSMFGGVPAKFIKSTYDMIINNK
jgi:acetyltransferase-like isoleucine patch superfamily enzyme